MLRTLFLLGIYWRWSKVVRTATSGLCKLAPFFNADAKVLRGVHINWSVPQWWKQKMAWNSSQWCLHLDSQSFRSALILRYRWVIFVRSDWWSDIVCLASTEECCSCLRAKLIKEYGWLLLHICIKAHLNSFLIFLLSFAWKIWRAWAGSVTTRQFLALGLH